MYAKLDLPVLFFSKQCFNFSGFRLILCCHLLGFLLNQNHFCIRIQFVNQQIVICQLRLQICQFCSSFFDPFIRDSEKMSCEQQTIFLAKHKQLHTYRISSYNCRGNYSFLKVGVRQLFKGGNYSREETIVLLLFGNFG